MDSIKSEIHTGRVSRAQDLVSFNLEIFEWIQLMVPEIPV